MGGAAEGRARLQAEKLAVGGKQKLMRGTGKTLGRCSKMLNCAPESRAKARAEWGAGHPLASTSLPTKAPDSKEDAVHTESSVVSLQHFSR